MCVEGRAVRFEFESNFEFLPNKRSATHKQRTTTLSHNENPNKKRRTDLKHQIQHARTLMRVWLDTLATDSAVARAICSSAAARRRSCASASSRYETLSSWRDAVCVRMWACSVACCCRLRQSQVMRDRRTFTRQPRIQNTPQQVTQAGCVFAAKEQSYTKD